jgi:hypothetical protein
MLSSLISERTTLPKRKCACGGTPGPTGECEECRKKRLSASGRSSSPQFRTQSESSAGSFLRQARTSAGQLPETRKHVLKPRVGHDFGHVRVNTPERAVQSSPIVSGNAYLGGRDSAFAGDDYSPRIWEGGHLASEEFARIVQRARGPAQRQDGSTVAAGVRIHAALDNNAMATGRQMSSDPGRKSISTTDDPSSATAEATASGSSCSYQVMYTDETPVDCPSGQCGKTLVYRVPSLMGLGEACPDRVYRLTERLNNDHGCIPERLQAGLGCDINQDWTVAQCSDTISICGGPARFGLGGCRETVTQEILVDGKLAETHQIIFTINKSPDGACSGSVDRR